MSTLTNQQLQAAAQAINFQQPVFPDMFVNGKPKKTANNYKTLFAHYNVTIKYNEMTKDVEIVIPGFKNNGDLLNNAVLAKLVDLCQQNGLEHEMLNHYIGLVAHENEYHPVRVWLDSLTWDGKNRMQELYDSVILDEVNPMKDIILRKWLLSLVASLYHPNFSCEGVLTFTGKQGIGKTTFIEELIPKQYRGIWNRSGVTLNVENKDSLFKALGTWITELGELGSTFKKSDIEALKGFITESNDIIRTPFDRKANKYPRRTCFYATVNDPQFLQDEENRRFWVLSIHGFNYGLIDVEQLWAQVRHVYFKVRDKVMTAESRRQHNEFGWFMSPSDRQQMAPLQERFRTIDPIEEKLENHVKSFNDTLNPLWLNCTEILERSGVLNPNKRDANTAAKYLQKIGFKRNRLKQFGVEFINNQGGAYVFDEKKILKIKN